MAYIPSSEFNNNNHNPADQMTSSEYLIRNYWPPCLLALAILLATIYCSAQLGINTSELPIQNYSNHLCITENNSSEKTLRILDVFRNDTHLLADSLCQDPTIAKHYGKVEVVWLSRSGIDLRSIVNQRYQLLFIKPEYMQRIKPTESIGYSAISTTPPRPGRLITLTEKPELTNEYFTGKTLGLLDEPDSISSFQIPKYALKHANIDPSLYTIKYFKYHSQLHAALNNKKVDIIASSGLLNPQHHSIELFSSLPPPAWFLQEKLLNTDIHCKIINGLKINQTARSKRSMIHYQECQQND